MFARMRLDLLEKGMKIPAINTETGQEIYIEIPCHKPCSETDEFDEYNTLVQIDSTSRVAVNSIDLEFYQEN